MNSTQYYLIDRGNVLAASCNRSAVLAARNALRNIFCDEANVHTMNTDGSMSAPIPYQAPTDGGNYSVSLTRENAAPDERAASDANERTYGGSGD